MSELQKRILLIEHEQTLREILRLLLVDEAGYDLIEAGSFEDGLTALSQQTFELILTDGFSATPQGVIEATAPLREAAGNTPIVLITAHAVEPAEALAAGFAAVVEKPFNLDALLAQIHALLA